MEKLQSCSVEILSGMGTQWHHVANKLRSTCQPRQIGENVLLNQQLWQNVFLQMKFLHYNPILILIYASIPMLPTSKVHPLLTECVLYILITISLTEK